MNGQLPIEGMAEVKQQVPTTFLGAIVRYVCATGLRGSLDMDDSEILRDSKSSRLYATSCRNSRLLSEVGLGPTYNTSFPVCT